ncbi:hypothetical protein ABEF95_005146 [Exophiala dermatitidis]
MILSSFSPSPASHLLSSSIQVLKPSPCFTVPSVTHSRHEKSIPIQPSKMRSSAVIATLLFTASALAVPLNAASGSNALEVKREAAPIVDAVVEKRALIDLSPVTNLVGDLLATVTGLLSTITGSVTDLDSSINKILSDAETDVNGTLTTVKSTLSGLISQLDSTLGSLGLSGSLGGVGSDLNTSITEVQTLLTDVEALGGKVDAGDLLSEVTTLVQQLLSALTGLTSSATKH